MPAHSAADPATTSPSVESDLLVVAVPSVSAIDCENSSQNVLVEPVTNNPLSSSERCVRLCRYRL